MGHITDYCGTIKLSDKKVRKVLIDYFVDDGAIEEYFDIDGITFVGDTIEIGGDGKMYDNQLEKFCLFIAQIDKKSTGEVMCKGEESDDFWKIDIEKGCAFLREGNIVYDDDDDGGEIKSKQISKNVYKITKDKTLLKEIIVEELQDGG